MDLIARTTIHSDRFSLRGFAPLYARRGTGPSGPQDYRIPQRGRCAVRRLFSRRYILTRFEPRADMEWPIRAPTRIAVVQLRGERLCFRMHNLAFFEETLQLSTVVNTQVPWLSFESPLVPCISGTGRVGICIDGQPECLAPSMDAKLPKVNMLRLAAWADDSRFGIEVAPGYANTVLVAAPGAMVCTSSLVIAGRDDPTSVGPADLIWRAARLFVP